MHPFFVFFWFARNTIIVSGHLNSARRREGEKKKTL